MTEENTSVHEQLANVELSTNQSPKTHILYEFEGERAVDPAILVENGIRLWHDMIYANMLDDLRSLWTFSSELLHTTERISSQSIVDSLRQQIILEAITPDGWDYKKFRAYKSTLISAIYFHEARRLCAEGEIGRAWHVTTTAYYYLGISTTTSASRFLAEASSRNHAEETDYQRSLVLWILDQLKNDKRVTSIEKAKDAVIAFIRKREKLSSEFEKLDKLSSSPKHSKDHDALDRLRNTLDDWSKPSGPYPEMAEAFSVFKRKRKSEVDLKSADQPRVSDEDFEFDTSEYYLRIVHILRDGGSMTVKLSRDGQEDAPH